MIFLPPIQTSCAVPATIDTRVVESRWPSSTTSVQVVIPGAWNKRSAVSLYSAAVAGVITMLESSLDRRMAVERALNSQADIRKQSIDAWADELARNVGPAGD